MHAKYIVINSKGTEMLFTFPQDVMHSWMFESVRAIKQGIPFSWTRPYFDADIVSAGFVNGVNCYGRSESLDVDSRPLIDSALLARGGMS